MSAFFVFLPSERIVNTICYLGNNNYAKKERKNTKAENADEALNKDKRETAAGLESESQADSGSKQTEIDSKASVKLTP